MRKYLSKFVKTAHNVIDRNKSDKYSMSEKQIDKSNEPADFEKAISAAGFGKFNILLLLVAIPSGWASMFESTTLSFVLPVAHCDLELTLEQKGFLISITYFGMLASAPIWGFLADTYGRKKLLVIGLLLDAFFILLSSFGQSYSMIMFSKFMGGFIINGPFAVLATALSEFHCAKYRAKVILSMGIVYSLASIVMPLLGMALLSKQLDFKFLNLELHAWNIYLFVSATPALFSGICHIFLPESPKFLMTAGKNEEALQIFKKIYSVNTGKPPETFPIKELIEEKIQHEELNKWDTFKRGFTNMKPLFLFPHLPKFLLVALIQFCLLMGLNSLRLWLPQIFTAMNDYHTNSKNDDGDASICVMLQNLSPNTTLTEEEEIICTVNTDNQSVYTNSIIVSLVAVFSYTFVGSLLNFLGKKRVLIALALIAAVTGASIYFANNSATILSLSSIYITACGINSNVMMSIMVDLFPTTLRTMAISLNMMIGRLGAMIGNIIMPYLFISGCLPPFIFVGISLLIVAIFGFLVPKTDLKALE